MALELIRRHAGMDVLDIHAGGVDLIFPHHEDEIAQSCAYTGQELFARYWVHGEFLKIGGEKMSKRYGNITTARDLREDGVDAGAVRLLMFQVHYRQQLDLTDEALASAREGSRRLGEFQHRLAAAAGPADAAPFVEAADRLDRELTEALDDDLNAPRAVAALFSFASAGNAALDAGQAAGPAGCHGLASRRRRARRDLVGRDGEGGNGRRHGVGASSMGSNLRRGDDGVQRAWARPVGGPAKGREDGAGFRRGRSHPRAAQGGGLGGPGQPRRVDRSRPGGKSVVLGSTQVTAG